MVKYQDSWNIKYPLCNLMEFFLSSEQRFRHGRFSSSLEMEIQLVSIKIRHGQLSSLMEIQVVRKYQYPPWLDASLVETQLVSKYEDPPWLNVSPVELVRKCKEISNSAMAKRNSCGDSTCK